MCILLIDTVISHCRVPLLDLHKLNRPDSEMEPIVSCIYCYGLIVPYCVTVCLGITTS